MWFQNEETPIPALNIDVLLAGHSAECSLVLNVVLDRERGVRCDCHLSRRAELPIDQDSQPEQSLQMEKLLHKISELIAALTGLTWQLAEDRKHRNETNVILHRIDILENNIMSKISDFAAQQKSFNDAVSAAVDSMQASLTGISGDITTLNDKITALQNSAGGVTPEDQALIDDLQAQGAVLSNKATALAEALAALDALTPPAAPAPETSGS